METAKLARSLLILTVVWNVIEAVVAIVAGWMAGSLALTGFGFDSIIETVAALVTLKRFSAKTTGMSDEEVEELDEGILKVVGYTFFALSAYIVLGSGWRLLSGTGSEESLLGIVLAGVSLVVMPILAMSKLKVANKLGSKSLAAEAKETFACAYLSLTLFLGMGAVALFGWWWMDLLTALLMVPWLVKEGMEAIEGDED